MAFLNDERETILRYDYVNKRWYAWTNVEGHINKFRKQSWDETSTYEEDGRTIAAEFEADKPFITIGNVKREKRKGPQKNDFYRERCI